MNIRRELIELIRMDAGAFPPSDEAVMQLLQGGIVRTYPKKSYIIEPQKVDTNCYVLAGGICRFCYNGQDGRDVTVGFAGEGTIFISPYGFYKDYPAHFLMQCIEDCTVIVIGRDTFMRCVRESHEIACWMLGLSVTQFFGCENKSRWFNDGWTAAERYENYIKRAPSRAPDSNVHADADWSDTHFDLSNVVPIKHIASYINVVPSYLSRLRARLSRRKKI